MIHGVPVLEQVSHIGSLSYEETNTPNDIPPTPPPPPASPAMDINNCIDVFVIFIDLLLYVI
jgi:hypothetical protein